MNAKEFLLQECENTRRTLEETLRYEYGASASQEFFEECSARLAYIKSEIDKSREDDEATLHMNGGLLIELCALMSRIERSSISEYSWPFVDKLKEIAYAICAESTLANSNTPPMVHVLSGGGLAAYEIYPERRRPSGSKRRILTIVFPRTLKHFVLLHSILGHELGHAIFRSSKHQPALTSIISTAFTGTFANPAATADWLYSADAPPSVKQELADLQTKGVTKANFFQSVADWGAWREEILCDLLGLLIFGPSFIAAECNLLNSLDMSGAGLGREHPPVACRINLLLSVAESIGYTKVTSGDADTDKALQDFWAQVQSFRKADKWFDVFTDKEAHDAAVSIAALLSAHPPANYPELQPGIMKHLVSQLRRCVPPTGYQMDAAGEIGLAAVDFRHILFAGWVVHAANPASPFTDINRLCEHGIMQQLAINIEMSST